MNINYSQVLPVQPPVPSTLTYISSSSIGHTYVGTLQGPNLEIIGGPQPGKYIDFGILPKPSGPEVQVPPGGFKFKTPPTEATKFDSGKANWSLMPFEAVEEILKVLEFGALKYDAHNWKKGRGLGTLRVLNSCIRHIFAFMCGEKTDSESGLSHISHAACNLLFAITYDKDKEKYLQDGVNEKNI